MSSVIEPPLNSSLVSLGMYDFPEMHKTVNDWWYGLARACQSVGLDNFPLNPDRTIDVYDAWLAPDLLLAQTCGYPLVTSLSGKVQLVATPCYSAMGCEGAFYSSPIVVRADEPAEDLAEYRGRVCTFNDTLSHSGYNALRHKLAPLARGKPFFASVIYAGGQRKSLAAIASREADITSIDCVSWALLKQYRPDLTDPLKVIDWTASAPGLPLITGGNIDLDTVRRLREGLCIAMEDSSLATTRQALMLSGIEFPGLNDYERITQMAQSATDSGYPDIC
jgi:ABC-type phosphate/phosphonate transport system substrate-binding protein